jgi:hypothetical protein
MFHTQQNHRIIVTSLALLAGAAAARGQLYQAVLYDVTHQFTFGTPSTWTRAEGRWFGHGWARSCNQWMDEHAAVTPWGQSGQPAQLPNFAMYGVDSLLFGVQPVNNGYPSPLSPPFPYNPPGSVNVPGQVGSKIIPGSGTTFWPGGWMIEGVTASNGFVRGDGWSQIRVNPYLPPYTTTNILDGMIRTHGGYTENSIQLPQERGYGFSFTELRANGIINPQYHPPMFWGQLVCIHFGLIIPPQPVGGATFSAPPPGYQYPYQPPFLGRRVYDPISYTATDTVTGTTISGTVVSMHADAGYDSSVDVQNGIMTITGRDVSVRIDMNDPRVNPQGSYELDIRNGVVVASNATGIFAPQAPPPVGSATPLSFGFPNTYAFSVDLNGFTNNPIDLRVEVSSAGAEPIAELTCAKIGLEPADAAVCEHADAQFIVGAHGTGALIYQWRRGDGLGNFWPVFDGPHPGGSVVSGSQTATLTIGSAALSDGGVYDCIVTDVCGTAISRTTSLTIAPCTPVCYANCDGSVGTPLLTPNDFACFLNAYAQGAPFANCDGSAGLPALTPNDFACFLNAYAAGCS